MPGLTHFSPSTVLIKCGKLPQPQQYISTVLVGHWENSNLVRQSNSPLMKFSQTDNPILALMQSLAHTKPQFIRMSLVTRDARLRPIDECERVCISHAHRALTIALGRRRAAAASAIL